MWAADAGSTASADAGQRGPRRRGGRYRRVQPALALPLPPPLPPLLLLVQRATLLLLLLLLPLLVLHLLVLPVELLPVPPLVPPLVPPALPPLVPPLVPPALPPLRRLRRVSHRPGPPATALPRAAQLRPQILLAPRALPHDPLPLPCPHPVHRRRRSHPPHPHLGPRHRATHQRP